MHDPVRRYVPAEVEFYDPPSHFKECGIGLRHCYQVRYHRDDERACITFPAPASPTEPRGRDPTANVVIASQKIVLGQEAIVDPTPPRCVLTEKARLVLREPPIQDFGSLIVGGCLDQGSMTRLEVGSEGVIIPPSVWHKPVNQLL